MCKHERNDATDIVSATLSALQVSVYNRSSLSAMTDCAALHGCDFAADVITDTLVLRLSTHINSIANDKFTYYNKYTKNWWESFKQRFFHNGYLINIQLSLKL